MILVFTKDADIYGRCWYLCMMLVFMHDAGIYARCWYLCTMLVFMHHFGIYVGIYVGTVSKRIEGFLITLFLLLAHLF